MMKIAGSKTAGGSNQPAIFLTTMPARSDSKQPRSQASGELDDSGRTEPCLMRTGSATDTKRAATRGQPAVHVPGSTAYWFVAPNGEISFTWRKTGKVEVWTPCGVNTPVKINGAILGVLPKLF